MTSAKTRLGGPSCAALLAAVALGCDGGLSSSGTVVVPKGAPIVLISVDTLRSDRLPVYGYRGVETPAIDALRRDSILYERAYAHIPLTLPSHASILTGLLPSEHGVRDNAGYRLDSQGLPLLPRLLKENGYTTGGAVSSFVLRSATGIAAHFDFYEEAIDFDSGGLGDLQRSGQETLRVTLPWLRQVAVKPFFLLFHLYEPHSPYDPPEPFASRYASAYDGEVAAVDWVVGELVGELKELGIYHEAVILLLSDHGEGLGDHGEEEHGVLLYREALQVPLILKLPGSQRGNTTVDTPAQLVDVMPTLLDLLGLPRPEGLPGTSLLELAISETADGRAGTAPRSLYAETHYPRLHLGWSELASVIQGPFHYIQAPEPELYDLVQDPAEKHNILRQNRRAYRSLSQAMELYDATLVPPTQEDPQIREQLAALGYLATSSSSPESGRDLPDPKSRISSLGHLESALSHMARRQYEAAIPAFRRLLEESPAMVDAWKQLAQALERTGRIEEALQAQLNALKHSNGAPQQALFAAPLFLRLGRTEEARAHARLAVSAFPATAHNVLARIALADHDLETATLEARRAVEQRGSRLTPVITLGEVLLRQQQWQPALELIRQHEEEFSRRQPPDPRLLLFKVRVLTALGRKDAARQAETQALALARHLVEQRPDLVVGHAYLTRILVDRGELDEALAALTALPQSAEPGAVDESLLLRLGRSLAQAGRVQEALAALDPLARAGDPAALYAVAMMLSDAGRQDEAQQTFQRLVSDAEDHPRGYEGLGMVHLRRQQYRQAQVHLRRALELDPELANSWNMLGVTLLQGSGDGQGALEAWQRALELDPELYDVLYNVGFVAARLGQIEVARRALDRFVKQAPPARYGADIPKAQTLLGQLGG